MSVTRIPATSLENKKAEVKLPGGGRKWSWGKTRHILTSLNLPKGVGRRGQESYKQLS